VQAMTNMNGGAHQSERCNRRIRALFYSTRVWAKQKGNACIIHPRISLVDFTTFSNDIVSYPIEADPCCSIEPAVAER
jgi:hypothetical protein